MVQEWTGSRSKEDQTNSPDADDKEAINCFPGMLNFLDKLSSRFSELSVPLTKISNWERSISANPQAVQCFQVIQVILGKDIKIPYFSTQKHTTLQTNALIKGLGVVLIQDGVQVYFASRTLILLNRITIILGVRLLQPFGVWNVSATSYLMKNSL